MRLTRRSVIAALPLAAACAGAGSPATTLYVTPDGEGDGGSWESAAGLWALDRLIGHLAPGGEILVAADAGAYNLDEPIEIMSGGRRRQPVRVRGVSRATGQPQLVQLRGPELEDDEMGPEGFIFFRGAGYLHFSHFAFERFGNGCFRVAGPMRGLTIEDCTFDDIYRFLENTVDDDVGHQASLRDFAVRRCNGYGVERGFARIRYASRDGVFEDCTAEGLPNEGGHIPAGVALDDDAHHISFRRCVMANFQQWRDGDYWNGDGFSDEEGNRHIVYENCVARGSTDGGFDCKSRDVVLRGCVAEDNKRNFRIWSRRATLTGCISRDPNFRGESYEATTACHIWIGNEAARIRIDALTIDDQTAKFAILDFDDNDWARVEINGLTIRAPRENWGVDEDRILEDMIRAR